MKFADIIGTIKKGIGLARAALDSDNQELAKNALAAVANVAKPPAEVTDVILDKTEAELDALLAEFNAPLPPE